MALYHSVKGSVNYTVVGNPTIVDGVASGFSVSDYIKTEPALPLANANVDIEIAINADTTFNNAQQRVFSGGGIYIRCLGTNPAWNIYLGEEASSVAMGSVSTYPYIKIIRTSGIWYCYRSSDGSSYEQVGTPTAGASLSDSPINLGGGTSSAWAGSINLNETYITVNGQPWFGISPIEVKKHQLTGPVGYTVVGSPTITDGVLTNTYWAWNGGANNRYLQTNASWPENVSSFELVLKVKGKAEATAGWYPLLSNSVTSNEENLHILDLYSRSDLQSLTLRYAVNNTTSEPNILFSEAGMAPVGSWAWIKITYSENTYSLYKSTDGSNYTLIRTATSSDKPKAGTPIFYGALWLDGGKTLGMEIDLNETYIKINDKLWFYQPAHTKYIVKDDKLVFADPRIYIETDGVKTYATKDLAPVPANYTYGTTTTSAIGYVDITTQQFTAAPAGSVIGRDE